MTTLPEVHLAAEAIVAHVDGELAPVPRDRANAHLARCAECRAAVAEQRRAKAALTVAPGPKPSSDLLERLRDIPMTTGLAEPGIVLAIENDQLVWGTEASVGPRGRAKRAARKRDRKAEQSVKNKRQDRPSGTARPASRNPRGNRAHRISVGFAGVAAAAVVGMLAVGATTASTGGVSSGGGGGRAPLPPITPASQQTGTSGPASTSFPGNAQLVDSSRLFVHRPARVYPAAAYPGR
jgi:hypothetical protein